MTSWDFPCPDPADISIDSWPSGSIVVSGEPTDSITVDVVPSRGRPDFDLLEQVEVGFEDGQLYVRGPRFGSFLRRNSLDLTIKAPAGSSCAARTASADLSCVGELSAVSLHTASGDLSAASVTGDVTVRSASGDVLLDKASGNVQVATASGDLKAVQIDGTLQFSTASGDVAVGSCAGSVTARTASGDVRLGGVAAGAVEVLTASGDVQVAVVPGIGVYLDLSSRSGDVRSDLDEVGPDEEAQASTAVKITASSWSGDIRITRALSTSVRA